MSPRFRLIMIGAAWRAVMMCEWTPLRSACKPRSTSSAQNGFQSYISPSEMSLTRMSRRRCSRSMRAHSAATCVSSRWSVRTGIPVPPRAATISAVSSMVSGRPAYTPVAGWPRVDRPLQYTIAPASPSAHAIPRPAPRVAPATSATCPFRGWLFFIGVPRQLVNVRSFILAESKPPFTICQAATRTHVSPPPHD